MSISALYLHMPFCVRRCRYCDFSTAATSHGDPLIEAYATTLGGLVRRLAPTGLLATMQTAYIGGGTPTMAGEGLASLVGAVRAACPQVAELSSEANPESLSAGLARTLASAGLSRVSLGVQSLDNAELARLGRVHDARGAREAMRAVHDADLDLSCDLMCAIPLQTAASLTASLRGVLDAGAAHVSCYPLMVEEGTPLWRACEAGQEAWPDDDAEADLMLLAERVLGAAGLERYEVASYARPGHACQHNEAYWTGRSYLGLGSSAAGMLTPDEFAALADALPLACVPEDPDATEGDLWERDTGGLDGPTLAARIDGLGEGRVARIRYRMLNDASHLVVALRDGAPLHIAIETLSRRAALAEDLMLGMRMSAGVGPELLARAHAAMGASLDAALADVTARGLARQTPEGRLVPTERGWLLGNELYGALWDLAEE